MNRPAPPDPDGARHRRASEVLAAALEVPVAEREAVLDGACRDAGGAPDDALRAEVRSLLDALATADRDGVLDRAAFAPGPTRVGPWRLVERIGEGGMGAVYRAERADGAYARTVAVKVLRPGAGGAALGRRLADELRLLAGLEHPHIARLYDGGVDAEGRAYLVMELVEGVPVTEYARGASVEEGVGLILQVCEAVAFAHRRLVVHRDLKPSNVLVAEDDRGRGGVRLLDFGIAALVGRAGPAAVTPAYAAPEQVAGGAVTTAADVYGVGALLYEVLTGHRPDTGEDGRPAPPSEQADDPDRARRLRGDLDAVCLRALAADPDDRYAGVDALAADLRRTLADLPIRARPATLARRLRLFVRRHRVAAVALAAVALAVVGGAGVAAWQATVAAGERDRAERRTDDALGAARALLYDVDGALENLPGATAARAEVVRESLVRLDRIVADVDDPALRLDLAAAYLRVGNVAGNPDEMNLGDLAEAAASFRHGLAALPAAPLPDSLRLDARHLRAVLTEKLAVTTAHEGDTPAALRLFDRATALYRANAAAAPRDPDRQVTLVWSHLHLGDYWGHPAFVSAGRPDRSLAHYDSMTAAIARARALGGDRDGLDRAEGIAAERRGTVLLDGGDADGALAAYRRSAEIRERLAGRHPADVAIVRDGGVAREKLGDVLRPARPAEALVEYRAALAVYRRLAAPDPDNELLQRTVAVGLLHVGDVLGGVDGPGLGRRVEARAAYAEALAVLRPLAARAPTNRALADLVAEAERALRHVGGAPD